MKESMPIVSIIIPVYNAEKYIAEAIESVLNQTFESWELFIINDGSTDTTADILATFEDERITILTQKNKGVSVARNRGIELAKGEYITFLDADDTLSDVSIEERVIYLENHKEVDVVNGIISIRDAKLKDESKQYFPFFYDELLKKTLHLDQRMSFNPCYLLRKEKLAMMRFKAGMHQVEDILFFITLCVRGLSFGYIDKVVYYYRVTNTSVSHNKQGLKEGYLLLLKYLKEVTSLKYRDTIIMRLKIFKLFLKWYIQREKFISMGDIIHVFK